MSRLSSRSKKRVCWLSITFFAIEDDLSAVARNELGDMVESQLKRERMIAGMAIENIVNNISRLVKQPAQKLRTFPRLPQAAEQFQPDAIVLKWHAA